ncbi:PTI1-like tyrosine-protein kinase 3 [Zea mays]|uniref:PTI1-like tyrosine-protein kinase 3 n=1 Tax=Zea mays TaxID=4577 RepID=A0A1D6MSB0_MAIZE|nr:PTI1-like tyrosine-protein kinase 3 [Zea mays]
MTTTLAGGRSMTIPMFLSLLMVVTSLSLLFITSCIMVATINL